MEPQGRDLFELTDLQTPWCVHVAASLHLAERIAAGTDHIDDLAPATDCDRDVLWALLGYLVGGGVFLEPEPGRFALNDTARQLLEPSARFLELDGIGGRMAGIWETLPSFVRTGSRGTPTATAGPSGTTWPRTPSCGRASTR